MHASWSTAMRTLLGESAGDSMLIARSTRSTSGQPIDITDRRCAYAGLLPAASQAIQTTISGAGSSIAAGAFADADAVVLAVESGAHTPAPYAEGTVLFEGEEPAAALRRGHVVIMTNDAPHGSDLLLPVGDESGGLRAIVAFRCGAEPLEPAVLALALQAGRTVARAAAADDVRLRYEGVIATIGHELRQPLSALVTALDLLGRTSTGLAPHPFEVAQRQTRQIIKLVDAVLDASRLSHRRLDLVPRRLDVRDVLHAAVESVRDDIAAREQRLELDLPSRPIRCVADAPRLQQVFVNLLTNANRYTPPRGAIAVRARAIAADIIVEVSDTGIGLDPSLRERIFSPFTQGRTGSREGLGLGLTISRGIVEGHGGSIRAESAGAGRGSTFVVRLPGLRPIRAGLRPQHGSRAARTHLR